MSTELISISNYLRLMLNGDKEAAVTSITVNQNPTLFTSGLTQGYTRKRLFLQNNNLTGEGKIYYGYNNSISYTSNSKAVPEQSTVEVLVSNDIPIYFVAKSGEAGDLRVEEIA